MKKILILLLTLIFTLNFFSVGKAETLQEAIDAQKELKQQKKQAKELKKAAKKANIKTVEVWANAGDVQAQMILSYAYQHGLSVSRNQTLAAEWKLKAEKINPVYVKNFVPVEYYGKTIPLARLYGIAAYRAQVGVYIKPSFDDAVRWAELGESEQDTWSMALLGSAYYTGRGVKQDYKTAIDYLKQSQKEALSLMLLSDAYAKGNGVEKDLKVSKLYADYLNIVNQAKVEKQKAKGEKKAEQAQKRADRAVAAEDRRNPFARAKERAAEKLAEEKEKIEIENAKQAAAEKNKMLADEVEKITGKSATETKKPATPESEKTATESEKSATESCL